MSGYNPPSFVEQGGKDRGSYLHTMLHTDRMGVCQTGHFRFWIPSWIPVGGSSHDHWDGGFVRGAVEGTVQTTRVVMVYVGYQSELTVELS